PAINANPIQSVIVDLGGQALRSDVPARVPVELGVNACDKIARRLAGGGKRAGFRDDRGASSKRSRPRRQLAGADSIMSYDLPDLRIADRMRGDDAIDLVRPPVEQQLAAKAIHPIANRHSPAIQPYLRLFGADQIVCITEGGGGVTHF